MDLKQLLKQNIAAGLSRGTITDAARWAIKYRKMGRPFPGPWTFRRHPWLREMHTATDEMIVGKKAAQMGYTEVALNRTFYNIDVLGTSVLYILPAKTPDASDFSTSRFDPALEMSEHLQSIFTEVKNIGHKRAGTANLFIRGSRSRSQLKSVPAGYVVLDELDEFVQENVPMIFERMSGQEDKQSFLISTPTIEAFGIDQFYTNSTQDLFYFKCPCCGKSIDLQFPRNIVITAEELTDIGIRDTHIICHKCKGVINHLDKPDILAEGKWEPGYTNRMSRGFHINQLYSCTVKPYELASLYLKSQTNPADEQEFFNSKLGLCHIVEGAQVTDAEIQACTSTHKMLYRMRGDKLVTMGVDVGKWLHFEIVEWTFSDKETSDITLAVNGRLLRAGKVLDFEILDELIRDYGIVQTVIDANPERRKAIEFAERNYGLVKLCFYANGITSKVIHVHAEDQHTLSVDRTTWMDMSLGRIHREAIRFPQDLPTEYKNNLKAPVRIYEKDRYGNPVGRYVNGSRDDHYAHARNYNEIALTLAASAGETTDMIERVL